MSNENQNRHIWIHSLKRLHPEIFSSLPESAETKAQNTAFDFLIVASELTSDVQTLTPTYLTLARAFVEQDEFLTTLLEKIERKKHLTPEEWGYLSYVILIFDFLNYEWEDFYESPLIPEEIRELGRIIVNIINKISFEQGLEALELQWNNSVFDLRSNAAMLLYVRACAGIGIYGPSAFYQRLAERLSLDNHFLIVYLAASCLKLEGVSARVDVGSWSNAQYACLMFMDTFYFLPGAAWG